jgi:septum site-determining protein MinD
MAVDKIMTPSANRLVDAIYRFLGESEFVLIDTAAGLGAEATAAIKAADELLVVVNPDLASVTDALKLVKVAEKQDTVPIGAVINRKRGEPVELSTPDIEGFLGVPVVGTVSEDYAVRKAASERSPVVSHSPKAMASQQFMSLAAWLSGESYVMKVPVMNRLFGWLRP